MNLDFPSPTKLGYLVQT